MSINRILLRVLLIVVAALLVGATLLENVQAQDAKGVEPAPDPVAPRAPAAVPPGAAGPGAEPKRHDNAAILRVAGEVDDVLLASLRSRLDKARKAGCTLVVYDIDTDGGLLTSALRISKLTKEFSKEAGIPVVAWVHSTAYSAGAVIALACKQVYMSPNGAMGDCAPIAIDERGFAQAVPEDILAKVRSPLLDELKDSSQVNGFDYTLACAMVIREIEIYKLTRTDDGGEVRFVDAKGRDKLLAETKRRPDGGANQPLEHLWKLAEQPVDTDKSLLTVSADQAVAMGLAKKVVLDERDLLATLNVRNEALRMDSTWLEDLTRWLTQWWVRGLLFVMMLVLAYVELSHPGISIAGIGALVCLAVLVGAPFLTGLAQAWEIILIVLGALIIIADIAVYGGVGMLAIPGFVLLSIGLVLTFVPPDPTGGVLPRMPSAYQGLQAGLSIVVFGSAISLGIFYALARFLYLTPGFNRLQLAPSVGPVSSVVQDAAERTARDVVFVGSLGRVEADLRPAGKARFDEHLLDVVSQGDFISAGSAVEVVEVNGPRIVVRVHRT